jgi:hypothetical protein
MEECCGSEHPYDSRHVRASWYPSSIKCLVIGENPGVPGSPYFYDPIPKYGADPVEVRRYLLPALVRVHLMESPTLEAFREAGFLFDHAIRCQLDQAVTKVEWKLAKEFQSDRAHQAAHLKPIIDQAVKVWIMGHVARDAVTHLCTSPAMIKRFKKLTPPYVENPKMFVSAYFTRFMKERQVDEVLERFKEFFYSS